mgnify:CR=1 FL=1
MFSGIVQSMGTIGEFIKQNEGNSKHLVPAGAGQVWGRVQNLEFSLFLLKIH